jgi:hypothetical protein
MRAVSPAVQSLTGKVWKLNNEFTESRGYPTVQDPEFMIYLRHHGFPSPLLDWTASPFVAAFFAFRSKNICKADNVAIYSYVEFCGHGKAWTDAEPAVFTVGNYVATDRRHHIQQCQYSFALKRSDDEVVYCNHESVFASDDDEQDVLTKYIIPSSERQKVLRELNFMNVNAYSLFGDEDGLMETLAFKEIEEREKE